MYYTVQHSTGTGRQTERETTYCGHTNKGAVLMLVGSGVCVLCGDARHAGARVAILLIGGLRFKISSGCKRALSVCWHDELTTVLCTANATSTVHPPPTTTTRLCGHDRWIPIGRHLTKNSPLNGDGSVSFTFRQHDNFSQDAN